MQDHHAQMGERAKAQGKTLPAPRMRLCDRLPPAAEQLFLEQGVAHTTLEQIARAAPSGPGTLTVICAPGVSGMSLS